MQSEKLKETEGFVFQVKVLLSIYIPGGFGLFPTTQSSQVGR